MNKNRTANIAGHYAYRAWDGDWYIVNARTGVATGEAYSTRSHAVSAMRVWA